MTADPDLPGAAVILQAATLRDTLKRLKEAEYDMANASFKPASARRELLSDLVNAILWAVVVGIPLFTLHMVMLDFEHSLHACTILIWHVAFQHVHNPSTQSNIMGCYCIHRRIFPSMCFSQAGANDCDALNSDSYANAGIDG